MTRVMAMKKLRSSSRTSSGSAPSASEVEPVRSANSTVTIRRCSADSSAGVGYEIAGEASLSATCGERGAPAAWKAWAVPSLAGVGACGARGKPHWLQKRAFVGLMERQLGQARGRGFPQLMQKRACAGLVVPQFGQIIASPLRHVVPPSLATACHNLPREPVDTRRPPY